ncbi:hypothetical protein FNV43_RR24726 [Rhamnella rubrinervis]|uniref:Mitochondrial carrier protein n=1 Tax=Rhamnella rubrinervis TaxID=2594499 RepID=A0A8K0DSY9_9ROSA|nr:hypothetical protein FNV43_RR24726 [Rhamnella rubrinervis]
MQTEERVGVVVEGVQSILNAGHGSDEGGVHSVMQQQQRSLPEKSQNGAMSHALAGGLAGALGKTCTAPLARLTILFQVQGMHSDVATLRNVSIWREASRIVGEEGFRAFWKGNLATVAHRLPYSSVNFCAYEQYRKCLKMIPGLESHGEYMSTDPFVNFISGGLAGITAASTAYPLDLVRTRLAAQTNVMYYRGFCHALQTICRDEGIFGLYKGLGTTLLSVAPTFAINFSVYEMLRSFWQSRRPHDSTALVSLACGSLSGIASSTATYPLDLVRRRKQLEGAGGRACVYTTGLSGTFRHIIQTEGFRGLYRGILPEYYKVVPGVGIFFMTYEILKALLAGSTLG